MIDVSDPEKFVMVKRQTGRWTGAADFEKSRDKFHLMVNYFEGIGWVLKPGSLVVTGPDEQAYLWMIECVLLSPQHPDNGRLRAQRSDLKAKN